MNLRYIMTLMVKMKATTFRFITNWVEIIWQLEDWTHMSGWLQWSSQEMPCSRKSQGNYISLCSCTGWSPILGTYLVGCRAVVCSVTQWEICTQPFPALFRGMGSASVQRAKQLRQSGIPEEPLNTSHGCGNTGMVGLKKHRRCIGWSNL